jgi:hypothetical protein
MKIEQNVAQAHKKINLHRRNASKAATDKSYLSVKENIKPQKPKAAQKPFSGLPEVNGNSRQQNANITYADSLEPANKKISFVGVNSKHIIQTEIDENFDVVEKTTKRPSMMDYN